MAERLRPICAYCGERVVARRGRFASCGRCFVLYHPTCLAFSKRCAIYGCGWRPASIARRGPPRWRRPEHAVLPSPARLFLMFVLALGLAWWLYEVTGSSTAHVIWIY